MKKDLKKEVAEILNNMGIEDVFSVVCNDYYVFDIVKYSKTEYKYLEYYSDEYIDITTDEIYNLIKKHKGFISDKKQDEILNYFDIEEDELNDGDMLESYYDYCYQQYLYGNIKV